MSETTDFHDRRGIPIRVGDLIRVRHFRHRLRNEQMWVYFRVALMQGRLVVQRWDDLDATKHQTILECVADSPDDIEVLDHGGLEYNDRGELIMWNERPRRKAKVPRD